MPPLIENPADSEICSVILYLSAKGVKTVEIHCNICEVYEKNIMSDEMVRKWVRAFKDGRKMLTITIVSRQPCCSGYHIRQQISMTKV